MKTSLGTFDDFLASAKEVSCADFYASRIAKENGIEPDWFSADEKQPICFVVLNGEQWFVKYTSLTYWTMVEREARYGSLAELARWVYDWLAEENNDDHR
jgi:hypothetical protein